MRSIEELKIYTADDEMPDCGRCDYITGDFDCCGRCGPEHGWGGYERTETEDDNEDRW